MERTDAVGERSENPTEYLAIQVPDGVVLDAAFVERIPPDAMHSEESLEEDDSFLSVGSETWDYDIADERKQDFIDALKNSQMVMEYEEIDDSPESEAEG